jgi:D-proline reductase (dithiol) PrdB
MEIIEDRKSWEKKFISWARDAVPVIEGGEVKKAFSTYPFVVNSAVPFAPPPRSLKEARIALISSSGAFVVKNQEPFDSTNPLGDPSFRPLPAHTDVNDISFRHEQYSKEFASTDPNVVFPLWLLLDLAREGAVRELFSPAFSFSGYIPNPAYFIDTTGTEIREILKSGDVDCALLVLV